LFDATAAHLTNAAKPVIAYASYGNNASVNPGSLYIQNELQFTYARGAMFNTFESYNGQQFEVVNHGNQGVIADFILKGGSLGEAHVQEPYGFAVAHNQIMFARMLTGGVTWAEAAWGSLWALSWQNIVIGDPLTTFTVVATNAPPSLAVRPSAIGLGNTVVGMTNSASFTVQNVGNGILSGTATVANAGPFNVASGSPFSLTVGQMTNVVIAFSPAATGVASNKIIFATTGGTSSNTVTGTGVAAPVITSIPVTNVFLGSTYNYDVDATGFPSPTFSLQTAPSGMSINTNNGLIAWTPTPAQLGDNAVSVKAANGFAPDAVQNFTVTVVDNIAPSLTIAQPSDLQKFTNSPINVNGTANDASGISSVTINDTAATLAGTNWSEQVALSVGTNLLTVIATDASPSANKTTNTVRAILQPPPSPFALVSPADGSSNLSLQPVLTWTLSSGDAIFSVEVATTTNFASPVFSQGGLTSTNTTVTSGLANGVTYFWRVTATNASGSVIATNAPFSFSTVPAAPMAGFTAGPTNGLVPLTVNFTNTSTGVITNQLWDFGDTNTSVLANPPHTYSNAGTFTVSLTVFGLGGSNSTTQANFIAATNPPPPQLMVSPTNLNFGSLTVGQTSNRNFQVINSGGQTLIGTATSTPLFAVTAGDSYNVAAGQTGIVIVSFSPLSAGAFATNVVFSSNGGSSTNAVSGTGLTPGQINVTPASTNFGTIVTGATVQATFVVTNTGASVVSNGTATVSAGPFAIVSGSPFNLAGFGTNQVLVSFTPPTEGAFSNTVMFTSANGGRSTNAVAGTGAIVPSPSFTGNPTNLLAGSAVTFNDTSTGTITNHFWDFGDGSTLNTLLTNFPHTYSAAGTNTVTLIVSGPVGVRTNTRENYIDVTKLLPQ
jgi:PKD repeat protein